MKSVYGFFMAWGMFCGIPCPVKIWNEDYRKQMLIMLPVLGLMLGGLWYAVTVVLSLIGVPALLAAAAATVLPLFLTGAIHIDGYMDVCDAVFSRRELEERRRILKDPVNGSFAMIGLVVWSLLFFGAAASAAPEDPVRVLSWMVPVPMMARLAAVIAVVSKPSLPGSQYSGRTALKDGGTVVRMVWQTAVIFVAVEALIYALPCGGHFCAGQVAAPAAAVLAAAGAGRVAVRDLGGMNGDISGAMITIGELFGMMACAVCM